MSFSGKIDSPITGPHFAGQRRRVRLARWGLADLSSSPPQQPECQLFRAAGPGGICAGIPGIVAKVDFLDLTRFLLFVQP
jgi:hypothetical protein